MYKKLKMKENVDCLCKTVATAHSIMTCHVEAYVKKNYLGIHIIVRL